MVWSDICYLDNINELLQDEENEESSSCSDDNEYEDDLNVEIENISDF